MTLFRKAFWFLSLFDFCRSLSIFILVGGTGELSSRSLWDAVFRQIYLPQTTDFTNPEQQVKIYTSGKSDDAEGKLKLNKILKNVHCTEKDGPECNDDVKTFASSIEYVKLENDIDYGKFCADLFVNHRPSSNITEVLWYLATPPSYYPVVLMSLHTRCRNVTAKLKVAIEEPFFKDEQEYVALSRIFAGRFKPDEILMVDYILGKETTAILGEFRRLNRHWYNVRNLDSMELALLERESVADKRLKFYQEYGAVKGSMMSHLNELMLLLLKDLVDPDDWNLDDEADSIKDLLHRIRPFARSDWLYGQSKNYRNLTKHQSKSPTFAALRFKIDVAPESGNTVEKNILFLSGKYMDFTVNYAKVQFVDPKNNFQIGTEVIFLFSTPLIFVSTKDERLKINSPKSWIVVTDKSEQKTICQKWLHRLFTQTPCSKFKILKLAPQPTTVVKHLAIHPHEKIIRAILGRDVPSNDGFSIFTSMLNVEQSWKIMWSHVCKDVDGVEKSRLTLYENAGEMLGLLFPDKSRSPTPKIEL